MWTIALLSLALARSPGDGESASIGDLAGTEIRDALDELSLPQREALLRSAILLEVAEAGTDPNRPGAIRELNAFRYKRRQLKLARAYLSQMEIALSANDISEAWEAFEKAENAMDRARRSGGQTESLAPWRWRLVRESALSLFRRAWPLLLPAGVVIGAVMGLLALFRRFYAVPRSVSQVNPYITGSPITDPALFFGREALIEKIVKRLQARRSVYLAGPRRIGKTSLMHHVGEAWTRGGGEFLFVNLDGGLEEGPTALLHEALLIRVSQFVLDPPEDTLALVQLLIDRRGPLLIGFDEIDILNEAEAAEIQGLFDVALRSKSPAVGLFTGVYLDMESSPERRLWRERLERIPVPALEDRAIRALLVGAARGVVWYSPAVVREVVRRSAGQPLLAQLYGLYLVDRTSAVNRRLIRVPDLDAVDPQVRRSWEAIQEVVFEEPEVAIDLDRALYEIVRLKQEIQLLEQEILE